MRNAIRLLLVCLCLVALTSCKADEAFTRAARDNYAAVVPEWIAYVDADPNMTTEQRERRHRTAALWNAAIAAREVAK